MGLTAGDVAGVVIDGAVAIGCGETGDVGCKVGAVPTVGIAG